MYIPKICSLLKSIPTYVTDLYRDLLLLLVNAFRIVKLIFFYNMGIRNLLFLGLSLCGGAGDWTQGYMFEAGALALTFLPAPK